jgi:hypothetical protein
VVVANQRQASNGGDNNVCISDEFTAAISGAPVTSAATNDGALASHHLPPLFFILKLKNLSFDLFYTDIFYNKNKYFILNKKK